MSIEQYASYQADAEITRQKTSYTELGANFAPNYGKDRLVVQTNSAVNIIKLARQNPDVYEQYIEIIKNDFILISHNRTSGYSVFMKRTSYYPERMSTHKHLRRHKGVIYTLTAPSAKKIAKNLPNRLLVLFSHMNGGRGYDSSLAIERLFVQFFADIQRSLVKNVFILRLADINLSHGSYFVSTDNYPEYEQEIQDLITNIRGRYNISQDHVVLYGGSKGGAGALLHSAIGDYKAVCGDPIIDSSVYNIKDHHFVKHFKEANLTNRILSYAQSNTRKKYIFGAKKVKFNYDTSANLSTTSNGLIHLVDLSDDETIATHPQVTAQSVPEQITLINLLFDGGKIIGAEGGNMANVKKKINFSLNEEQSEGENNFNVQALLKPKIHEFQNDKTKQPLTGSYQDSNGNIIEVSDGFTGSGCYFRFCGKNNKLKIAPNARLKNVYIEFLGDDGICELNDSPRLQGAIRLGYGCTVKIEKNVSCTNAVYITCAEHTNIFIGEDCMFATNNQIRTDDAHGIYDVKTGKRLNNSKDVYIGKHVWLGFNTVVLGGAFIGDGSVVGMNSLVKKKFPNNCVIAGNPAKLIKKDIFWERPFLPSSDQVIEFSPEQLATKSHCNPTQEGEIHE